MATIGEQLEGMKLREGEHLPEPSIYTMDDDESPSTPGGSHDTPMCNTPTGCVPRHFSFPLCPPKPEHPNPNPTSPPLLLPRLMLLIVRGKRASSPRCCVATVWEAKEL